MTKLVFIRHGETSKNVKGILHDYNDSETLNETGRKQIELTTDRIRVMSPTKIYSSTEPRAIKSAEIISQKLNIKRVKINDMHERNWGKFTGKPWSEIKTVLDPMSINERYNYVPPGGESWMQFEKRLIKTVDKVLDQNKDQTVVIVTHGGAIRALMPYLLNMPKEESFKYDPDNASITLFEYSNGTFVNVLVNDSSHLN